VKYKFIQENRDAHSVINLCRVFRVSSSAFYTWCQRSVRKQEKDTQLLNQIHAVHEHHRGHSGALKTWRVLKGEGVNCGKHQVARIRRDYGIVAKRRKRFVVTTRSKPSLRHAPNVLARAFTQSKPNQAWVGDVTYIPTRQGHVYLAVLLDLHSRLVVGWSMSNRNDVVLIAQALKAAVEWRKPKSGLIHHSDRGGTYASRTYTQHLEQYEMTPSMSAR
jgi:putative transposase